MVRMQILLDDEEAEILARWAATELRDPREQIHFIIRTELYKIGLLPQEQKKKSQIDQATLAQNSEDKDGD